MQADGSEVDLATIVQIIERLHGSTVAPPTLAEQQQLQHALFTAQQSPAAWSLGGQLLEGSSMNTNVRFFGAHTLTVKISRDWGTLPEDHWTGLKEAMLGWLSTSARMAYPPPEAAAVPGERIVLRKLAVAVTSLSFRLAPKAWPEWLLETILRLSGSGCSRLGIYEVLTLAIEEVGRADMVGSKRVQYEQVIADVAPRISSMIVESLSNPQAKDPAELNAALRCLQGWVVKRDINRSLLEEIYPLVLQLLPNESTCISASACVEDILLDTGFATEKRVASLLDFCASAEVGQFYQNAQTEQDVDDVTLALFKLLIAVFEHSYTEIVAHLSTPRSVSLLQRLLLITCFPGFHLSDETVSDRGLPIWSYLQEEITDNGIVATQSGHGDARWPVVKEVFDALVAGLRVKVAYPRRTDFDSWPKDIRQGFSRYRIDVGDCLINAYYVLRDEMLSRLVQISISELAQFSRQEATAEDLESTLFCITSIHEAVPMDEESALTSLFGSALLDVIPALKGNDVHRLQQSSLRLIEVYGPWFRHNPSRLLAALQCSVTFLSSEHSSQAAALALSSLCDSCRTELLDHVGSFAQLVQELEGRIPNDDFVRVVGSVAAVIQALPAHRMVAPVVHLVEASIGKLAQALSVSANSSEETKAIVLLQLSSLSACAKSLAEPEDDVLDLEGLAEATDEAVKAKIVNGDQRVESLRNNLLEAVKAITSIFRGDAEISQSLGEFLKACTNTNVATPLSLDVVALLEIVSQLIQSDFEATWLAISSILLFRLRKNELQPERQSAVQMSIARVFERGLGTIADLASMETHPDLVQSFMDWSIAALTSYASILVAMPQMLENLFGMGVRALGLQERVGLQKSIQFLTAFVNEAASDSAQPAVSAVLRPLVQAYGQVALHSTLGGVGGKLPRSNLGYLTELLLALSKRFPDECRVWLKALLSQEGFPSHRVTQDQKNRYGKAILSARSLRKLREATESFAIVCRGLEGTSYAIA